MSACLQHVVRQFLRAGVDFALVAVLRNIRVVIGRVGALLDEQVDHVQRRAFAVIVDIGLVGRAEHQHLRAVQGFLVAVQNRHGALNDILRHAGVDFAGSFNQAGVVIKLTRLPREVERVERDAVAAEARARIKRLETVRLRLGGLDDLPDVDAHAVADDGHFVCKADVDVAVGVFEQLLHFRHGGGRNFINAAGQNAAVKRRRDFRRVFADAADDLRRVLRLVLLVARIDALRREPEVEILAALQAARFEDRLEQFFRRARVSRGFQNDDHAGVDIFCNGLGGALHIADIRLLVFVERSRHADGDGVDFLDKRKVGSSGKLSGFHHVFQRVADDVADVVVPGVDGVNFFRLHVEADGFVAGLREFHRERQADVAEAHNADNGGLVLYFAQKFRFDVRHIFSLVSFFRCFSERSIYSQSRHP